MHETCNLKESYLLYKELLNMHLFLILEHIFIDSLQFGTRRIRFSLINAEMNDLAGVVVQKLQN